MALIKSPKADLRSKYLRYLQISFIISLLFLIAAFKYFPEVEMTKQFQNNSQELFIVENILQTRQETKLPPPAKPPILIEKINDELLEDIEINSTELNVNALINSQTPPISDNHKTIEQETDYIFKFVEQLPEPIGGIASIQNRVIYLELAIRAGIEGKVVVIAQIDEFGNVMSAQILKSLGAGCDEAALTAVLNTRFLPGKQRGKAVKVEMKIPVIFKLQSIN